MTKSEHKFGHCLFYFAFFTAEIGFPVWATFQETLNKTASLEIAAGRAMTVLGLLASFDIAAFWFFTTRSRKNY